MSESDKIKGYIIVEKGKKPRQRVEVGGLGQTSAKPAMTRDRAVSLLADRNIFKEPEEWEIREVLDASYVRDIDGHIIHTATGQRVRENY